MTVTRDVVLDLLPIYLAGEASADTQALVAEHLERDADLAKLAQSWRKNLATPPPVAVDAEAQARAFHRAQRLILVRTLGLAALITVGVLSLIALVGAIYLTLR